MRQSVSRARFGTLGFDAMRHRSGQSASCASTAARAAPRLHEFEVEREVAEHEAVRSRSSGRPTAVAARATSPSSTCDSGQLERLRASGGSVARATAVAASASAWTSARRRRARLLLGRGQTCTVHRAPGSGFVASGAVGAAGGVAAASFDRFEFQSSSGRRSRRHHRRRRA